MNIIENILLKIRQLSFTAGKQQHLLEDLANLLEDGVSVNLALELMIGFATSPLEIEVIRQMQIKMAEGESFLLGLDGWVQSNLIEVMRAGESGGTLVESIRIAATTVQNQNEAFSAVIQGLIYPATIFIAALCVLVYIASNVFPSFEQIKPVSQWPSQGQMALQIANFIKHYWWAILLAIFACVIAIRSIIHNYIGDLRAYIDKVPPFSIYRLVTGARLMETLGLLISNGVALKKALHIIQASAPPYLQSHLLLMEYRLSGGRDNIADVLDTGLIEKSDLARLRVVSLGKGFDESLMRQGRRSMDKAIQVIKVVGKIGGGTLMGLSAALLAFIFFSIYTIGLSMANA